MLSCMLGSSPNGNLILVSVCDPLSGTWLGLNHVVGSKKRLEQVRNIGENTFCHTSFFVLLFL